MHGTEGACLPFPRLGVWSPGGGGRGTAGVAGLSCPLPNTIQLDDYNTIKSLRHVYIQPNEKITK